VKTKTIAVLAFLAAWISYPPNTATAQDSPQPAATLVVPSPVPESYSPPWRAEGETFLSYGSFRDELVAAIRQARKRVAVVTPLLSDGDVATSLFAARVRRLQTLVLLDARASRAYNSRHEYLARTQVPTWLVALNTFRLDAISLVVIDDGVWRVGARFDDSVRGSVRVEASSLVPDEVFQWRDVRGARFARDEGRGLAPRAPSASRAPGDAAKKPTTAAGPGTDASVTMGENTAKKQSGSRIPRRLPRETRLQRLQRQSPEPPSPASGEGSMGSLKVPAPPPNEMDVSEE
jgi:hypothetical protein